MSAVLYRLLTGYQCHAGLDAHMIYNELVIRIPGISAFMIQDCPVSVQYKASPTKNFRVVQFHRAGLLYG